MERFVDGAEVLPLGDRAAVVRFGRKLDEDTHRKVRAFDALVKKQPFPGLIETVPSFAAVAVFYDARQTAGAWRRPNGMRRIGEEGRIGENEMASPPENIGTESRDSDRADGSRCSDARGAHQSPFAVVRSFLEALLECGEEAEAVLPRTVEIPVRYGAGCGPDLEAVARYNGLTEETVIELHTQAEYTVYMLGFAPGFPYLGGLPERLATPRLETPRLAVPAGSVGIGGGQTGVYTLESPGGWQLIGRTPVSLFRPDRNPPALLDAGDKVRFRPVGDAEYERLAQLEERLGQERTLKAKEGGTALGQSASADPADMPTAPKDDRPVSSVARKEGICTTNDGERLERHDSGQTVQPPAFGSKSGAIDPEEPVSRLAGGAQRAIRVLKAGLFTTVQDLGRTGSQRYGVPCGGAVDTFALRTANVLVGNDAGAAALEITLNGPELAFEADTLIAVCGGDMSPTLGGRPVPAWRPVLVRRGAVLRFGACGAGCRGYLAAAGGIAVPAALGSRSTYVRAALGGLAGRALRRGDELPLGTPSAAARRLLGRLRVAHAPAAGPREADEAGEPLFTAVPWYVSADALPAYRREPALRFVRGCEYGRFDAASQAAFESAAFAVTPQSDRMGCRLDGPRLALGEPFELLSEAVTFGTVQVPPSGRPIVLMADRQTTGGYPRIAQIAAVDLPVLAQVRPGEAISFQEISLEEAEELLLRQESQLELLQSSISLKLAEYR
ncbi:5-oxoprolinase subunit PxpB [Paenibacillus sp. MBLB4367]|uniref:5-oxoprolinase subunit PxpB n=1 Tax=Paenibacillus sp. MBLB4367 TaxID=3384767 RepID=UPI003908026A